MPFCFVNQPCFYFDTVWLVKIWVIWGDIAAEDFPYLTQLNSLKLSVRAPLSQQIVKYSFFFSFLLSSDWFEVILKILYPADTSITLKWLAASKGGKVFICPLKVPQLNKLKISIFYFYEYRELRYVFSHIFHYCPQPFVLLTACKLLPLAIVTGSN